ncbi:MAG: HD domain-containing protein, partial [Christensenellales bacterium]
MAHSAFKRKTLQEMLDEVQKAHPDEDVSIIEKAYAFSANAHDGQKRMSGEPYFTHPAFVASILTQIMLDVPTIAAGLLHDVVEDV